MNLLLLILLLGVEQSESIYCRNHTLGQDYVFWMDYAGVFESKAIAPKPYHQDDRKRKDHLNIYDNPTTKWYPLCKAYVSLP